MISQKIKAYLDKLAASEKRPSSYLFHGSDEKEKEETAFYFIQRLAGKDRDDEFTRRAKEEIHPDVIIVKPETIEDKKGKIREKEIVIEQIREAQNRLKFFPYELERKFCLIKKSQRLNQESGNALLKILEEPSKSTFFILLANEVDSVLPTIASRSSLIRFPDTKLSEWQEENRDELKKIATAPLHEKFEKIEKLSKDKSQMQVVLADWEKIMAESLRKLVSGDADRKKIRKVVDLIEKIREAAVRLENSNASARAAGEKLMLGM